ncbi:MAG TPA: pyrroloquinoline quinone-dependent dehydrogenase [Vicinamibacterales bacterium]|nr:pyrroloquinoline quinone-dependent dehydrogenase [Vicinamibacterales bacterium]
MTATSARSRAWQLIALLAAIVFSAPLARGKAPSTDGNWPVYGGDPGGMKYSALAAINREDVGQLAPAWSWRTGEKAIAGPRLPVPGHDVRPASFEVTPIVIDDVMYLSTPYNRVVALNADSGKELWTFDPRAYDWGQVPNGTGYVHRGIAMWLGKGERRLFMNSRWRLIALNPATGKPIPGFGYKGEIDLTENLTWPTNRLHYTQTSPPVIYKDLVIVGNGVWDGFVYRNDPPGVMQAFDVRTGKLVWKFDLIPQQGEFGNATWENGSGSYTGHTNVWAPFTVDERRGLLYLPVGTPSNDYYGGHRHGDNLFAESLLCLDANTGRRVWHFQAVHHGLWDYDLGSPPTLLTVQVNGRKIDVVAAPSKIGFLYVFDRETGKPVWPIEEREVPPSDVPGERASRTQPFPTKPPPFATQGFTEDDVIDFTPEVKATALKIIKQYRHGPLFMPPSLEGTISMPGVNGGGNWGGAAADPETGVLYVRASNSPSLLAMGKADPSRTEGDYDIDRTRRGLQMPGGLPINKPPYGTLTAIDLNKGEHAWQVPLGDTPSLRSNPALRGVTLPARLGAAGLAGPVVTKGGLVFIPGGSQLYAFDKSTGAELWAADLAERGSGTPMTYATSSGRQLVVVATGGGDRAVLEAFALSQKRETKD